MQKKIILKHFFSKQGNELVFEFYHPLYEPKICLHLQSPDSSDTLFGVISSVEGRCKFERALIEFSEQYELNIINQERLIKQSHDYVLGMVPKRFFVNYVVFNDKKQFCPPKFLTSIVQDINPNNIIINVKDIPLSIHALDMHELHHVAAEYLQATPSLIIDHQCLPLPALSTNSDNSGREKR